MATATDTAARLDRPGVAPAGSADPYAPRERRHNEGHGRRLTTAFEALEAYPVLVESRNRILRLFEGGSEPSPADIVAAVEADVALTVTVVRLANQVDGPTRGRVESVVSGVEVLSGRTVHAIASRARTFDFFERTAVWHGIPERFRLHATATQRAADRLAREIGYDHRDRLMVSSLLHDIGKLVLVHAYPGYPGQVHGDARTPEERLQRERRELGVDHALVGGVLARRWVLPRTLASVIERHHAPDATDEAAIVRLADMLAHYVLGGSISPSAMLEASRTIGLSPASLRTVMYELPLPSSSERPRQVEPCPMSARELDVLKRLAKGMVYKQIASELGLSTSTIRTHLHNVYGKLGAMDRAQAVLIATERGWL
jgi:putative nucleotidyltransferase with HDIG domain